MFAARLGHRCSEQRAAIYRLTLGIHRLENVEETVVRLRDQMTETQPVLAENAKSTQELLAQLAKQSESVAEKRAVVSREEQVVRGKAEQVAMVQQEAQRQLDQAMPELEVSLSNPIGR